ncbi:hypothetical protein C9374_006544 [Naegleria lovaniensis]|uniref:Deacetylase sirtuin-type domain-containing protein n=1 Tax=Naegleria lovaniensis TaxID=51637 RepID=A0AA88GL66_NAELO|nr:uncharacterized protein C9374_006544 [Naegleria lovaniensis]KAG2379427.1 hypothetical protein C9374_006544 [Naegleria lovaniensis]
MSSPSSSSNKKDTQVNVDPTKKKKNVDISSSSSNKTSKNKSSEKANSKSSETSSSTSKSSSRKNKTTHETKKKEIPEREEAFEILAQKIAQAGDHEIICLTGAGLSTAAGIPDFRTPGTGLYDNLQKYNLPRPTAIFELEYFKENPTPFFLLSRDFISQGYKPTKAHYFIKLLENHNKLMRLYTQNIDGLEAKSGISKEFLVNCHGMYDTAHCIECSKEYTLKDLVNKMGHDPKTVQIPLCDSCNSYVKPDIVLFGEELPKKYSDCVMSDLKRSNACKIFLIIGTSLSVYPVAFIPNYAPEGSTRALLNRERCGPFETLSKQENPYKREIEGKYKHLDLFLGGDDLSIDQGVEKLCKLLGWERELEELVKKGPIDLIEQSEISQECPQKDNDSVRE